MLAIPILFFLSCAMASESSDPPSPPSSPVLETWEIALIAGCGTLALLMCAYSIYILTRRRPARAIVTDVPTTKTAPPATTVPGVKSAKDGSVVCVPGKGKTCTTNGAKDTETVDMKGKAHTPPPPVKPGLNHPPFRKNGI